MYFYNYEFDLCVLECFCDNHCSRLGCEYECNCSCEDEVESLYVAILNQKYLLRTMFYLIIILISEISWMLLFYACIFVIAIVAAFCGAFTAYLTNDFIAYIMGGKN